MLRSGRKIKDLFLLTRAIWRLRGFSQAIVYTNFVEALPLGILLKWCYGYKLIAHIRLPFIVSYSRQFRWAGRRLDSLIVINRKHIKDFENEFLIYGKVNCIFNGIDIPNVLPAIEKKPRSNTLHIVYLGRIAEEKGIIELLQILFELKAMDFEFDMKITGDFIYSSLENFEDSVKKKIDNLGLNLIVEICRPINNPISYLSDFDLFIFPSTWDEPFGRTIPESIMAGTPVLARSVGMVEEIMQDNLDFVFSKDSELLVKISQFHTGDIVFDFESARATIARKFNKDRMIDQVESELYRVL